MKATTKKLFIVSMLMTIIIGVIITSISSFATGNWWVNTTDNHILNTINDANKTPAILNQDYQLHYIARDMAKYNNVYCIQHSQSLDQIVGWIEGGVTFSADTMIDIVGDRATFYKKVNRGMGAGW